MGETPDVANLTLEIVRRIDGNVVDLATRVTNIEAHLGKIDTRLTKFDARFGGLAEDMRIVKASLAAMQKSRKGDVETSAVMMDRLNRLEDQMAAFERKLEEATL